MPRPVRYHRPDPVFELTFYGTSVAWDTLSRSVVSKKSGRQRACVQAGEVLVIMHSITPARGTDMAQKTRVDDYTTCAACEGSGKNHDGTNCFECSGTGKKQQSCTLPEGPEHEGVCG